MQLHMHSIDTYMYAYMYVYMHLPSDVGVPYANQLVHTGRN